MKNFLKIILIFLLLFNVSYSKKRDENVFKFSKAGEKVYNDIFITSKNGYNGLEKNGKIIIPCKYKGIRVEILSENLIYIRPENRRDYDKENIPACYLINSNGEILYKARFIAFDKVLNHKLWLIRDEDIFPNGTTSYGLIDYNGNFLVKIGKYGYLSIQIENPHGPNPEFENRKYIPAWSQNKKVGLITLEGREVIKPIYDKVKEISDNQTIFYKNGYATLLDDKLNTLIPLGKYNELEDKFKNTNMIIAKNDKGIFILNKISNKKLYTFNSKLYNITKFFDNTWVIYDDKTLVKLVDKNFNEVIDVKKYKNYSLEALIENNIKIIDKKNKVMGVMNINEKFFIPIKYYSIEYISEGKSVFSWNTGGYILPITKGGGAAFRASMDRSYKYDLYIYLDGIKKEFLDEINDILKGKYEKHKAENIYISDSLGNILDVSAYKKIKINSNKEIKVKNSLFEKWQTLQIKK